MSVSVIGVPFDEFSSYLRGPAQAPSLIRQFYNSDSSNYFTESGVNLKNHPDWHDEGDLVLPTGYQAIHVIQSEIESRYSSFDKLLSLGGDHSITYPVVKALSKKYPRLNILHLDAHPDLYQDFEGNKFSHACPFARIMEEGLAQRLVQVGIRTMNDHQRDQATRYGVEVFEMRHWQEFQKIKFEGPIYISLDIDAIDPAYAPGVSHHEPGGFTSREIISILQKVKGNVVGADLVEYNPTRDPSGITGMLAAKLFKELLDVLLRSTK